MRCGIAVVIAATLVAGLGTAADPPPTVAEIATQAREAVLDRVRESAGMGVSLPVEADEPTPEIAASTPLTPGAAATLTASGLGLEAVFSGHDVPRPVTVEARMPVAETRAARAAASETGGDVMSDVVEIIAAGTDGQRVTSFPAELHDLTPDREEGEAPL